jgi:predicted patatin/cPLA2 family phospholipase
MKTFNNLAKFMFITLFITACSTHHELDMRVDEDNYKSAQVAPVTNKAAEPYRFWGDEQPAFLFDSATNTTPLVSAADSLNILVLSGGGANGAFGTGVINALYDTNQFPEYSIVTGISAGSMIAPFAFVGGDQIHRLKEAMLGINDKEVLGSRNFLNALIKDAFTNGDKLFETVEHLYNAEMIEQIAQEHNKGRRLFIGTTHFDSGELVIWNVGAIAASDLANKNRLIHQILAASSSIPEVFPPQFIQVEVDGEVKEELHVDGGMNTQMFASTGNFNYNLVNNALGKQQKPTIHIIRNGVLKATYKPLRDKGVDLIGRSLETLLVQQTRGDLYRMLYSSEINQYDLSFTYIEHEFDGEKATKQMFDQQYMQALYKYGYDKVINNSVWQKTVP